MVQPMGVALADGSVTCGSFLVFRGLVLSSVRVNLGHSLLRD